MSTYRLRGAGAVIHSHGLYTNLVTLLEPATPSKTSTEFKITCQEMIKGIMKGSSGSYHPDTNAVLCTPTRALRLGPRTGR